MSYNRLVFVVESNNPRQQWRGNVETAFEEYIERMERHWEESGEYIEGNMNEVVQPGRYPDNIFEASNGLRIWWYNPPMPEDMKPDPPDPEAIQQIIDDLSNNVEDDKT